MAVALALSYMSRLRITLSFLPRIASFYHRGYAHMKFLPLGDARLHYNLSWYA